MSIDQRGCLRSATEAPIDCLLLTTSEEVIHMDGILRNISRSGAYIESTRSYDKGAVLIVRILRYPLSDQSDPGQIFRSIGVAEVKRVEALKGETMPRYGMGLRYLH